MGTAQAFLNINVNRNIIDPKTRRWWEGPNYEGPSDKTVAAIKFENLSGEPIAVYYNYAMHGVAAGQLDLVSGDAPGHDAGFGMFTFEVLSSRLPPGCAESAIVNGILDLMPR